MAWRNAVVLHSTGSLAFASAVLTSTTLLAPNPIGRLEPMPAAVLTNLLNINILKTPTIYYKNARTENSKKRNHGRPRVFLLNIRDEKHRLAVEGASLFS